MDPDANLERQLELAQEIVDARDAEDPDAEHLGALADALAEHVLALHDWIASGGFLPQAWRGE